jgi:hypothetical protein
MVPVELLFEDSEDDKEEELKFQCHGEVERESAFSTGGLEDIAEMGLNWKETGGEDSGMTRSRAQRSVYIPSNCSF